MQDFLAFLKGSIWYLGILLIAFAVVFGWRVLLWPVLPLLSRLGVEIAGPGIRRKRDASSRAAGAKNRFRSTRHALDYLAQRIKTEAELEGVSLTEIERKMLYFSETASTLPDTAKVSDRFDAEFDQDAYEEKIAGLIRNLVVQGRQSRADKEVWDEAVERLSGEDCYFQVLLDNSLRSAGGASHSHGFLPTLNRPKVRPPHDRLKLWITAIAIVFVTLGLIALSTWLLVAK